MILMICSGSRASISLDSLAPPKSRIPGTFFRVLPVECNDTQDFCTACCMSIYLQLPTTTTTAASNESACVAVCALIFKRLHGNLLTPGSQPSSHPAIPPSSQQPRPRIRQQNPSPDDAKAKAQTSAGGAGLSRGFQGVAPKRAQRRRAKRWQRGL